MLNVDHTHSHAIIVEIGERLRAGRQSELPASLWRQLDQLRELDEESIVPPMDAATRW